MAHRDDIPLTPEQLSRYAKNGSGCPARMIRSMAQELQLRREWDAPQPVFTVTPAEQRMIEAFRAMQEERKDAA